MIILGNRNFWRGQFAESLNRCMTAVQERLNLKVYVLLGNETEGYWNVASSFREAVLKGMYLDKIGEGQKKRESEGTTLSCAYYSVTDSFSYLYHKLTNSIRISALCNYSKRL